MVHDPERPRELELARSLLRAIEPPLGAFDRVERNMAFPVAGRKAQRWWWGAPLGVLALAAVAAAAEGGWVLGALGEGDGEEATTPVDRAMRSPEESARPTPRHETLALQEPAASGAEPPSPALPNGAGTTITRAPQRTEPASPEHGARPRPKSAAATAPDDTDQALSAQVASYEHAEKLARRDTRAGLAAFRKVRERFPEGPLRTEVDLQILRLVNQLGDASEVQREAQEFTERHPDSPRAPEISEVISGGRQ